MSNWDKYQISWYWAVTTITTVGYGDISGNHMTEKMFSTITMIIGVAIFSYANGAISSLLTNKDEI